MMATKKPKPPKKPKRPKSASANESKLIKLFFGHRK